MVFTPVLIRQLGRPNASTYPRDSKWPDFEFAKISAQLGSHFCWLDFEKLSTDEQDKKNT